MCEKYAWVAGAKKASEHVICFVYHQRGLLPSQLNKLPFDIPQPLCHLWVARFMQQFYECVVEFRCFVCIHDGSWSNLSKFEQLVVNWFCLSQTFTYKMVWDLQAQ